MVRLFLVVTAFFASLCAVCQVASPKPQVGTISAVTVHKNEPNDNITKYDVSLKIEDTTYVVLFTPPSGSKGVEYALGQNVVALVGPDSITVTRLGHTSESRILRREDGPSSPDIDWRRAPGEYFSQKLRHLSAKLGLTEDQQGRIKPILEQEAAHAGQIIGNSALSAEDKFAKLENIVRASDQQMKPVLSDDQWETLQNLRKQQKQDVKELLASKSRDQ